MVAVKAYLSLGSNLGNRMAHLRGAIQFIENSKDVKIEKVSSVYETEPVGGVPQENFYNMVIEIETTLLPQELLNLVQSAETELKRQREVRWGPRTIDIDILLYGDMVVDEDNLKIPHPEMSDRAFVLVPLLEIAPDLRLPNGDKASHYLERVSGQAVEKIGSLI